MMIVSEICRAFLEAHPDEAARALERKGPDAAAKIMELVPRRVAASSLGRLQPDYAVTVLTKVADAIVPELLAEVEIHTLARILRSMPTERRERMNEVLPGTVLSPLRRLLKYPIDTVGARMDPQFPSLFDDLDLDEALKTVRNSSERDCFYWFVTDRQHTLNGVVSVLDLLSSSEGKKVGGVKVKCGRRLSAHSPLSAVRTSREMVQWQALPVVDESGRLQGALRQRVLSKRQSNVDVSTGESVGVALGELYQLGLRGLASSIEPRDENGGGS